MGLRRLLPEFDGAVRVVLVIAITGIVGYLAFLMTIDVPMYLSRWRAGVADGSELLGPLEGLRDVRTRWVVTHDLCAVEGRDCLDVALFHGGRLGPPRPLRFVLARGSSPALSYGRKLVVGSVGGRWPTGAYAPIG